jgi:hypothetical protein
MADFAQTYSREIDAIREALEGYDRGAIYSAIKLQREAQDLYHAGRLSEATAKWEQRDRSLPDWMFYYHGYFS